METEILRSGWPHFVSEHLLEDQLLDTRLGDMACMHNEFIMNVKKLVSRVIRDANIFIT